MANPYNEIKQRWNAAHYVQIKVSVNPEIAAAFKAACASSGVSIASVLSKFMADYSIHPYSPCPTLYEPGKTVIGKNEAIAVKSSKTAAPADSLATRRLRRDAVNAIVSKMEQLVSAEESYRDRIPANLQNSMVYDAAEESIAAMYEIIELLQEVY